MSLPYTPRRKFYAHRSNARRRGIQFYLTFDQWWEIWQKSGHWDQRGRLSNQYVMSRYGDSGPYEVGNVFIQQQSSNTKDAHLNKEISDTTKHLMSLAKLGKPKSKTQCPHCDRMISPNNLNRHLTIH